MRVGNKTHAFRSQPGHMAPMRSCARDRTGCQWALYPYSGAQRAISRCKWIPLDWGIEYPRHFLQPRARTLSNRSFKEDTYPFSTDNKLLHAYILRCWVIAFLLGYFRTWQFTTQASPVHMCTKYISYKISKTVLIQQNTCARSQQQATALGYASEWFTQWLRLKDDAKKAHSLSTNHSYVFDTYVKQMIKIMHIYRCVWNYVCYSSLTTEKNPVISLENIHYITCTVRDIHGVDLVWQW